MAGSSLILGNDINGLSRPALFALCRCPLCSGARAFMQLLFGFLEVRFVSQKKSYLAQSRRISGSKFAAN
jgi:hypothetical protein